MNDPIDEIFNGTPDGIDEDELKEMQAAQQQRQVELQTLEQDLEEEKESSSSTTTESQPKQETKPSTEEKQEGFDLGQKTKDTLEQSFAFGAGALDFGVDTINIIPGVDLPKLPKFHNQTAQTTRELFSIIAPTVGLTTSGIGVATGLAKASKAKAFLMDPFVRWLGTTSFSAGAGATVDAISELSEDDNATGMLKKKFPKTLGFIPDNIATLDSDSPDTKRMKNIVEGIGLGLFTDLLTGAVQLGRNIKGILDSTRWIPESERAGNWFAKNADEVDNVAEASAAKRSEDLDSLGAYNFEKSQNLDEPIFGIHDMYGYEESGIRSTDDMGIIGASVDQARIAKNLETSYGRLGSVMSEPAMKYSLEGVEEYEAVMRGLRDTLSDAGEYGYRLTNGKVINSVEIRSAGEQLAKDLGYMTNSEMEQALKSFKTGINPDTGAPMMSSEGMTAVKLALKDAMNEFGNAGDGVAHAYVRTSLAGQVSDMAQGMRYSEGSAAVLRSQEQILDRIEMLMIANGETGKQRGLLLNLMNVFNRGGKKPSPAELRKKGADVVAQLQAEAKQTVDTLREIKETRPEMLGPLMLAYEATDGDVKSIDALNNYVRQSTGVLSKAFYDGQPEIPSLVMRGFWANVYNSTLSALATPIKAAASNSVLLLQRPISTMAGAMITGDKYVRQRGMYQYMAALDTLQKGMKYMGETFRRSGIDPTYQGVAGRESQVMRNEQQIEILNAFADAKAAEGEYGPQAMMAQIEQIQALADHPWLRFGNRAMQAFDGFTQAVIGNIEARGKAFDLVAQGKIDKDIMEQVAQKSYEQMFKLDEKGRAIITDEAVRRASGEIAMNLDNGANKALSSIINSVPALKPFLLFTKTPLNMMAFAGSHNPLGLFINQLNDYSLPFNKMPRERVEHLLSGRGIPLDDNMEIAYNTIRAEMKGRKAIGFLATLSAGGLFLTDRIHGNGIYDRQKQQLRRQVDWKPRSIKGLDGKWYSYDNLGAITDWLAFTADVMDNFDTLGEANVGKYLSAAGFVLSASVTDKSMLAGIEPLYDILSGNPAAINRWASSFIPSATVPGASQLAELGRLISPNLRVVEENLFAMLANRTPLKAALPDQYDWIDGDKVNMPDNIMARLWNTYSPWKVNGKISDEKQFLIDIEYDARPSMKTDGRGVDLTLQEQAEVYRYMGKNGDFKKAIQRIMRTKEGKEFRRKFKEAQKLDKTLRLEDFESVHLMLDRELRLAKGYAIFQIDQANGGSIRQREFDQKRRRRDSRLGEVDNILKYAR